MNGRRGGVAVLVAIVVGVAGCGGSTPPRSPSASGTAPASDPPARLPSPGRAATLSDRPDPAEVDDRDPGAVCRAFATTVYLVDTAEGDTSWNDAGRRAAVYAAPALATQLRQGPEGRGGAEWIDLRRHRGFSEVSVLPGDQYPPDSAHRSWRSWAVHYTLRGRDRWNTSPQTVVVWCTLTKVSGRWRVLEETLR